MSLKKQTNVRTGKMVRELMLADEDVTASLIMVYSNNGVNEEIKIEGLTPKSNEELFLSGTVDWNKSVIYKIVDFAGKAEVGKALLTTMNKNNLTLEIERVMWSKGNKEEAEKEELEKEEEKLTHVHTDAPEAKPLKRPEVQPPVSVERVSSVQKSKPMEQPTPLKKLEPTRLTISMEKPKPIEQTMSVIKSTSVELQEAKKEVASNTQNDTLQENYVRLVAKAVEVCQDYELGIDVDHSVENLKTELQQQGIEITFNTEIMNAVNQLRSLKQKGINIEKVLNLL